MRYSMDDVVSVGAGGNPVSSPLEDRFSSAGALTGVDLTTADGLSDLTLSDHLDGTASVGTVYQITLTAGVTYSFAERPTATGGIADPFLRLYDAAGHLITYDDDGGAGHSSLLTYTPTVTGTYQIAAGSWDNQFAGGHDTGGFTLDIWTSNDPDAGSTIATATSIGLGTTFGQLASRTDIDMYRVDLTQGGTYTFGYSGGYDGAGETGSIATIALLDSAGHVIASNLNYESALSFFADQGGTYYVRVTPYTSLGTARGGYTLDVNQINPADYDPLDAIRWTTANNIPTNDVNGVPTATIYFGAAGENFGQTGDNGQPMVTLGWTQAQIDAVLSALNTNYSPITGIHYVQTTDQSTATFRLATDHSTQYGAYFDPRDPAYGASQGVGVFNVDSGGFTYNPSLQQGGYSYAVLLHEFGHAHGLAHPHDTGGGSTVMLGVNGSSGAGTYGVYDLNQGVYTVMSYNDGWPLDPDGAQPFTLSGVGYGWSGSLGAFDIAALQERYGVHAYATGDNVYTLPGSNGPGTFYQTIWDTGGIDTIAYNGSGNAQIDLLAATLDYSPTGGGVVSYVQGIHGGFTIANGVVIENATGGSGNDVLLGNSANNVLTGNAGNDTLMGREGDDMLIGGLGDDKLDGGTGFDTASYATASAGVTVDLAHGNASGGAGNDTLISIENVIGSAFADRIIGDDNANTIASGNGIDVVTLGGGDDIFMAELGTKVATKTGTYSWDIITDFNASGHDMIDLSGLGTSFNFRGSANNSRAGDLTFKVYDSINGAEHALGIDIHDQPGASGYTGPVTIVYGNTDGGSPDFAIVLLNTNGVSASDFIFSHASTAATTSMMTSSMTSMMTSHEMTHADYMFA